MCGSPLAAADTRLAISPAYGLLRRTLRSASELLRIAIFGTSEQRCCENLDEVQRADAAELCALGLLESSQLSGMRLTDNATFSLEPEIGQLPRTGPVKRRRFNRAARPPGRFDGGRFGSSP